MFDPNGIQATINFAQTAGAYTGTMILSQVETPLSYIGYVTSAIGNYPIISSITGLFGLGIAGDNLPEGITSPAGDATQWATKTVAGYTASGVSYGMKHVGTPVIEAGMRTLVHETANAAKVALKEGYTATVDTAAEWVNDVSNDPTVITKTLFGKGAPANTTGLVEYAYKQLQQADIQGIFKSAVQENAVAIAAVVTVGAIGYAAYRYYQASAAEKTAAVVNEVKDEALVT